MPTFRRFLGLAVCLAACGDASTGEPRDTDESPISRDASVRPLDAAMSSGSDARVGIETDASVSSDGGLDASESDASVPPGAPRLRVGFAKAVITPLIEDTWTDTNKNGKKDAGEPYDDRNGNGRFDAFWLAGFSQNRPAAGVHDDLFAVACVIDDGATRIGIVALDAIGFMYDQVKEVRARIDPALGLDHVIVLSTHNHEVPDLVGIWGPSYIETGIDDGYMELVQSRAAEAVEAAARALEPATMRVFQKALAPDGLVADTRQPIVYDPDLRALQFVRENGESIGQVVAWANHPEVLWSRNLEVTADFVGYLRNGIDRGLRYDGKVVREGTGGTTLYVNGAIGGLMTPDIDLEVFDRYLERSFVEPSHDKARALGHAVADEALDMFAAEPVEASSAPTLDLYVEEIELPVVNPTFRAAAQIVRTLPRTVVGDELFDPRIQTEMNLVKLGGAWIVTVPGELYPEIANGGVESPQGGDYAGTPVETPPFREVMQGKVEFVFGLSNDFIGYIIPRTQWDEASPHPYGSDGAQYGEGNSLGPDTGPLIYETFSKLIDRAK